MVLVLALRVAFVKVLLPASLILKLKPAAVALAVNAEITANA
jgi:hypothetical protein